MYNWLLALKHNGTFVLRIEDTDAERSSSASESSMLDDLRWLGLDWDGEIRRQSEHMDTYRAGLGRLASITPEIKLPVDNPSSLYVFALP